MSARARRIFPAPLAALLLVAATAAPQDLSTWVRVSPPQSRFRIRMPGTPSEVYEPETGTHNFEIRSGEQRYMVSWVGLSRKALWATPQQNLESARDRFLQLLPASSLVRSEPASVAGCPALMWVLDTSPANRRPLRMKGIAAFSSGRLFVAAFMADQYRFDEEAADRFLATFEVLP
ncbi:MAG: hypothetical protein M3R62_09785 [Acidobacteriota bacterium]|nr:hypothetical protein [Acidobacteriota bacterium]